MIREHNKKCIIFWRQRVTFSTLWYPRGSNMTLGTVQLRCSSTRKLPFISAAPCLQHSTHVCTLTPHLRGGYALWKSVRSLQFLVCFTWSSLRSREFTGELWLLEGMEENLQKSSLLYSTAITAISSKYNLHFNQPTLRINTLLSS